MSFKKFALAFGIAIILPMMLNYGASTIAPKPKRGEYDFSAMLDSMAEKNIECLTSARFGQGLISPKLWFPITKPS
jgi:hypothetical protein